MSYAIGAALIGTGVAGVAWRAWVMYCNTVLSPVALAMVGLR